MSKAKTEYRIGVGASSVLMILVVLAMTALALLSFDSARNTETLTMRNVSMSSAYYKAAARVQEKLAMIDAVALERRQSGEAPRVGWFKNDGLAGVAWEIKEDELFFTITEETGDQRVIVAFGRILAAGSARYELLKHTLVEIRRETGGQEIILMGE